MVWQTVSLHEKGRLLQQIHAMEPHQRFRAEDTALETLVMPFYPPGSILIRARERIWADARDYLWYVHLPQQDIVALDGSIANIHHLNFHAGLRLTKDALLPYLKFRLYFGLENGQRRFLTDLTAIDQSGDDFICSCHFYEERDLYAARLSLTPRGEMKILEKSAQAIRLNVKPLPEFMF